MQADFRLILLMVGLGIMAIIFWDGIKRRKSVDNKKRRSIETIAQEDSETSDRHHLTTCALSPKNSLLDHMIAIQVIANNDLGFSGKALLAMIAMHQLQYNAQKIYDRYTQDRTYILYSLASIIEPGTFDRQRLAQKNYPGVMLFMMLNTHEGDLSLAFESMLNAAYEMADVLDAQLCDLQHNPLSQEKIDQLRLKIRNRMIA